MTDKRFTKFWTGIVKQLGIDKENQADAQVIFTECMQQAGYLEDASTQQKSASSSCSKGKSVSGAKGTPATKGGKTGYHLFYSEKNKELKPSVSDGNERKQMINEEWKSFSKAEKAKWSQGSPDKEEPPRRVQNKEKVIAFDSDVDDDNIVIKKALKRKPSSDDEEPPKRKLTRKPKPSNEDEDEDEDEDEQPKRKLVRKTKPSADEEAPPKRKLTRKPQPSVDEAEEVAAASSDTPKPKPKPKPPTTLKNKDQDVPEDGEDKEIDAEDGNDKDGEDEENGDDKGDVPAKGDVRGNKGEGKDTK